MNSMPVFSLMQFYIIARAFSSKNALATGSIRLYTSTHGIAKHYVDIVMKMPMTLQDLISDSIVAKCFNNNNDHVNSF